MKYKTFVLKNSQGMELEVSNLGGIAMSLTAPDREGTFENILLGFDDPTVCKENGYVSMLIGRVCNRISQGRFTLDGKTYTLALNAKAGGVKSSAHGGNIGFGQKVWDVRRFDSKDGPALEMTILSPDGDEGYPGNLFVRVVYTLMDCNAWRIEYWAMTDAPTVFNPTQHAYFNLNGCHNDVLDHLIQINADFYTPFKEGIIPTGEVKPVAGTPLDFRDPKRIGEHVDSDSVFFQHTGGGYDHNVVVNRTSPGLSLCAIVEDQKSGRQMETWSTEPCMNFYTANHIQPGTIGRKGLVYGPRYGFCLETQHAPDSPNQPGFESIRLNPGQVFQSTTIYQFYTI